MSLRSLMYILDGRMHEHTNGLIPALPFTSLHLLVSMLRFHFITCSQITDRSFQRISPRESVLHIDTQGYGCPMTMLIWNDSTEHCKKNVWMPYHVMFELSTKHCRGILITTTIVGCISGCNSKRPRRWLQAID